MALEIEYLVVGGGGGGGETIGGGGGGGAVNTGTLRISESDNLEITIGLGGAGGFTGVTGAGLYPGGYSGGLTRILNFGFIVSSAAGGGAGGGYNETGTSPAVTGGGHGGGQGAGGGAGVAPGSGLNSGGTSAANTNSGAGGGGAGAVGANSTSGFPGAGGNGIEWPLGSGVYFGGGGGGGARDPSGGTGASGGSGGGGSGGTSNNNGTPGADNTGGGGGGGGYRNSDTFQGAGGTGGTGIVKIRYPGVPKAVGGDIASSAGYTVHTFNNNGSFTRSGAGPYVGFQVAAPNDVPIFTATANEGDTVTVKFKSENQTGVINYSITGVSSSDISGAALSGSITIVDYEASFDLNISEDASINEGDETLTVSFVENLVTYQESLTILDTSRRLSITPTAVPGDIITVTLNTSSTEHGESFVFQNVGFAYSVNGYAGNFPALTLYKGRTYTFDFQAVTSSHPIALRLASGNTNAVPGTTGNNPSNGVYGSGAIVTYSVPLDAPSSIVYQCVFHSGMIGTVNLVDDPNSGVPNGTEIPYTISGEYITASNIGQPLTGNFTVNNNSAEFTIIIPTIVSTTLTVTAYGETASCSITFNPSITVEVIDMDTYVDLEVSIRAFSMLPLSAISIADSSSSGDPEPGFIPVNAANFADVAVTVTVADTTENGSIDNFIVLPFDMFIPKSLSTAADPEPGLVSISSVDFQGVAVTVTVTDTTETGGLLDFYVVRPLGQELIREYWI